MSILLTGLRRILIFLALGFVWTAQAAVFYRDDRQTAKPSVGDPLARIGTLTRLSDGGRGTAFLIGRCHILTNFHVAFPTTPANLGETSVFQLGSESPVTATPVLAGRIGPDSEQADPEDWALLRLKTCLGEKYGWFRFESIPLFAITREPLIMAGFPEDRSLSALSVDPACNVHFESVDNPEIWRHDCASRPGSSGSPLLIKRGSDYRVVALNSTERSPYMETIGSYAVFLANGAIPAEKFLSRLQSLIDQVP